jgi:hypothetical protein
MVPTVAIAAIDHFGIPYGIIPVHCALARIFDICIIQHRLAFSIAITAIRTRLPLASLSFKALSALTQSSAAITQAHVRALRFIVSVFDSDGLIRPGRREGTDELAAVAALITLEAVALAVRVRAQPVAAAHAGTRRRPHSHSHAAQPAARAQDAEEPHHSHAAGRNRGRGDELVKKRDRVVKSEEGCD